LKKIQGKKKKLIESREKSRAEYMKGLDEELKAKTIFESGPEIEESPEIIF